MIVKKLIKLKILIKFIIWQFILLFLLKKKFIKLKVCLCTIGKEENRYIREFLEFYKRMKVDKIFLYDNNDLKGETFEEVISDYINSGFVELINFRGFQSPQLNSYNNCYKKNSDVYDWILFYDIDEYIHLEDFRNIRLFLRDKRFYECERIQLNWVIHTDNNLLYYDKRSIRDRFLELGRKENFSTIKSIIRGHKNNLNIYCIHMISDTLKNCDGFGNKQELLGIYTNKPDYKYYYIDHYSFKSTEEFIGKLKKTDAFYPNVNNYGKVGIYFSINKITKEKIDFIERETNFNLSDFKKIINYNY